MDLEKNQTALPIVSEVLILHINAIFSFEIEEKAVTLHQNRNTLCHARPME